jgi:hypothetical protein
MPPDAKSPRPGLGDGDLGMSFSGDPQASKPPAQKDQAKIFEAAR